MNRFCLFAVRITFLAGCIVGLTCLSTDTTGQEPKIKPAVDPERAFQLGDTDKDGKLSKEEFAKLMANTPRVKDNPKAADFLFNRLDANGDGYLSLEEFKRIAELAPKKDFPKKDFFKKKDQPAPPPAAAEKPTADQIAFFEKKIRPVLTTNCYQCHSEEGKKEKGGLLLDTRDGIRRGGDNGPAVVPGDTRKSLLLKAIKQTDATPKMPPKSKLSDEVVADFEKWISTGAADPRDGKKVVAAKEIDIEKGRQFWAFQPPKKTDPPGVADSAWPRSDIDKFLIAGLDAKGLKPVGDADPRALVRRIYFDLIGLPPTPEDVESFVQSAIINRQSAIEAVVDKLLNSPRFGETWGRHWLDVARYAESCGKTANFNYPHAWRYRDYVIAAFNADKPYDQFIKEQLAGDLLPAANDKEKAEHVIATGFLAIGPKALNERNGLQFELDVADEQIDVTSQAFLGITAACARCHDHKFDPIPQHDYYALAGIFRSTETCYGTIRFVQSQRPTPLIDLPDGSPSAITAKLTDKERADIEKQIKDLQERMRENKDPINNIFPAAQVALLRSRLDSHHADGTPKLQAMGTRDKRGFGGGFEPKGPPKGGFGQFGGTRTVSDSPLYARGEPDKPSGERIPRGTLQVMTKTPLKIRSTESGRKDLAEWIASKDSPLTARVFVNRVWSHLFGRGIVPTIDNFGAAGQPPSNQALLDHLALSFTDDGWSTKKLIRRLVLSHAYQLDSTFDQKSFEADPDNALVWRTSPRRLDAECLRDSMLAISGQLNSDPPVGSPVAQAGEGPAGRRFGGGPPRLGGGPNDQQNAHRSVYLPIIREQLPESLALFDFPDPNGVAGERAVSTVPAQALYLMNNPFVIRQAEFAADRLRASSGSNEEKVKRAYETFFARPPSEKETRGAIDFLASYGRTATDRAAWTAFTQALFASAEFANLR